MRRLEGLLETGEDFRICLLDCFAFVHNAPPFHRTATHPLTPLAGPMSTRHLRWLPVALSALVLAACEDTSEPKEWELLNQGDVLME